MYLALNSKMNQSYSTRVQAPTITQPEVVNAYPGEIVTRTNDATQETHHEPSVVNSKNNKSVKKCKTNCKNKESKCKSRLLSSKRKVSISTINVRTIRIQGKLQELSIFFKLQNSAW